MRKILTILWLTCFTVFSPFSESALKHSKLKGFTVTFCVGNVIVSRKGTASMTKNGDSVQRGDIFHLSKNAMLQITSLSSVTYSIKGPAIFRFTEKTLKRDLNLTGFLYSFFQKISRSSVHYYPKTIVTAVRGRNEKENRMRNIQISKELKEAIDLYQQSRFGESLVLLKKISAYQNLQRHVTYLIIFYRGEIHFQSMDYAGALEQYLKVYRTRNRKFRHRQNAHAKAVLSALYSGKDQEAGRLIKEYREIYNNDGRYSSMINNLTVE